MFSRIAAVIATAMAALLLPLATSACATEEPEAPTRVMLVGDSITQGATGDYTWRYFLWKALESSPESFDFVGPRDTLHKAGTDSEDEASGVGYADPSFDRDHAARWGMGIHWVDGMFNWVTGEWWYGNSLGAGSDVTGLVTNHQPDVIVNMLGYNDLNPYGWNIAVVDVVAKQREFIIKAREVNPNVTVVLGQIGHSWTQGQKAVDYNAALTAMADELDTPGARVVLVPMAIDSETDVYDGAHPNVQGETKIAEKVRATLAGIGVGTGSTPVATRTVSLTKAPTAAKPVRKVARLGRITRVKANAVRPGVRVRWSNAANSTAVEVWKRTKAKKAHGWSAWRKVATAPAPSTKVWDVRVGKRTARHQFKVRPVAMDGTKGAWSTVATVRR